MTKYIITIILLSLFMVVAGCGKKDEITQTEPLVQTQKIAVDSSTNMSTYAGNVRGRYEKELSFQVSGKVLTRKVQVGDKVHAGDLLMVIDPKDIVQQVNQNTAKVNSAHAQLVLAQANLQRYQKLYEQEAVSGSTIDQYQANYDAAVADYQEAVAAGEQGKNSLSYTELRADRDSVVSAINVEAGQIVSAGQTVLKLVETGDLEVEINVPENRLKYMQIGTPVNVSFWALDKTQVNGSVREISPMADATARTYKIRISIPKIPDGLQLGMTASVNTTDEGTTTNEIGATVPMTAIYQTGDKLSVWVVNDDHTVSLRAVEAENLGDNQVKIKGIFIGDVIVTAGVNKLHDGEKVKIFEDDNLS